MSNENLSYRQLRKKSQTEIESEELEFDIVEAQQQLEGDIHETKKELSSAKKKVLQAYAAKPFNSKKIIEAELEVEGYEAGLKRLEALKERLFPAENSLGQTNA